MNRLSKISSIDPRRKWRTRSGNSSSAASIVRDSVEEADIIRSCDTPRQSSAVEEAMASPAYIGMDYERFEDNASSSSTPQEQQLDGRCSEQPHIVKELYTFFLRRSWKKKLFTIFAIATIIPAILDLFILPTNYLKTFLDKFLDWMADHPLIGVWAYICVLIVASLIFIPPSILIFGAGFTFQSIWGWNGIFIALIASYLGSVIGGLIGFWRAKYMTRDLIEVLMRRYPIIMAVDAAIVRNSLRVMLLMRLNCLIPFGVLNYVFGTTGVDAAEFSLAMIGISPWHLLLISLGASSSTVYDNSGISLMQIIMMAMGVAFGIIALAITWKFAKKELQKEVNSVPSDQPTTAKAFQIKPTDLLPTISNRRRMATPDNAEEQAVINSVEDADLYVSDYILTQWCGEEHQSPKEGDKVEDTRIEEDEYRKKLGWNEILLDDFS